MTHGEGMFEFNLLDPISYLPLCFWIQVGKKKHSETWIDLDLDVDHSNQIVS